MPPDTTWKKRIRAEVKRQGRSLRSVSTAAGLGHSSLRYLLTNADTLSLETARGIALALGVSVKELLTGEAQSVVADGDLGRVGVKLVGIREPSFAPRGEPDGFAALPLRLCDGNTLAFRMPDNSMQPFGLNMPPPERDIVCKDDIVIWSTGTPIHAGKLAVVVDVQPGGVADSLTVRKLAVEDGDYVAVANNIDYGRQRLNGLVGILGGVISAQRVFDTGRT